MDLEDEGWVNIPYDGLLEVHGDDDEKIFLRKYVNSPTKLIKPDHFNTSQKSQDFVEDEPRFEKELDHKDEEKEVIKHPIVIEDCKESSHEPDPELEVEPDQDPIFQVFSKKENKFVEMKMDSQESEEKSGEYVVNCSSPSKMIKQEVVAWEESNQNLDFWKWGLSGIGAFCSIGMAAATICIITFGHGRRHKQQNQKLRIQIYPDNKVCLSINIFFYSFFMLSRAFFT